MTETITTIAIPLNRLVPAMENVRRTGRTVSTGELTASILAHPRGPPSCRADDDARVLLVGRPVEALLDWLEHARLDKGPVFRAIDRWEGIDERALSPQSVNLIIKRRCGLAGFDPRAFSAHGLRSGYLTEAARQGIALPEAMQQSQHRSV